MKAAADDEATGPAVALYGGSFDPIHAAHLEVARAVLRAADVQRVVFIPAAQSPLKRQAPEADADSRLQMLQLAVSGEPRFAVDDRELRQGGVSYTIDTVRAYRAAEPDKVLYWIVGADQFERLPDWWQIGELAALTRFIVVRRPGYAAEAPKIEGLRYLEVEAALMPHSSREVRQRISEGRPLGDWLPRSVEAFIYERGLYTRRPS